MALMALMGGEFDSARVKLTSLLRQCPARKKNEQEEKSDTHCEYCYRVPPFIHESKIIIVI